MSTLCISTPLYVHDLEHVHTPCSHTPYSHTRLKVVKELAGLAITVGVHDLEHLTRQLERGRLKVDATRTVQREGMCAVCVRAWTNFMRSV